MELCSECQTIKAEALLSTRRSYPGEDHQTMNENYEVISETHIPAVEGVYLKLHLDDPERSVETCQACKLFNEAAYGGTTRSKPTVLNLYLSDDHKWLHFEDLLKVEAELLRVKGTGEVSNLDGKGTVSIFTDYGELLYLQWPTRVHYSKTDPQYVGSELAESFPMRRIGEAGSEASIASMHRWIQDCDANHPTCSIGLTGNFIEENPLMPTRVIYVGSEDGTECPRLLETKGSRGRYIAVSHSWGKEVKPFTTKAIVEGLKERIDCDSLPKTFQESISIARTLGLSYVWIDSVCIIQDDEADWAQEARTMGLIYEKAYLTISASNSPGDHAGFWRRHPEMNPDVELRDQGDSRDSSPLYLRKFNYAKFDPTQTPLSRCGWVVQERIFSRRILHFDDLQVHWECSQHLQSEDGSTEKTSAWSKTSYWAGQNIKPLISGSPDWSFGKDEEQWSALCKLYNFFMLTIRDYSSCKLTYPSDKLPAILGLVNEIRSATGIDFIDGHFLLGKPLFVYSLLWYTEQYTVQGSAQPNKTRAPTWSWAAMEGNRLSLFYDSAVEKPRKMLLEVKQIISNRFAGLDPYHSLLCSGRIIKTKRSDWYIGLRGHREERIKPPTTGYEILDSDEPRVFCNFGRRAPNGWVCFDSRDMKPETFFLVAICECKPGQQDDMFNECKECPVLVLTRESTENLTAFGGIGPVYKRVGLGGLRDSAWFDDLDEITFTLI